MIDNKTESDIDELQAYKGRWRNLWFLKNGDTMLGTLLSATQQESEAVGNAALTEPRNYSLVFAGGAVVHSCNVSHFVPMPAGE